MKVIQKQLNKGEEMSVWDYFRSRTIGKLVKVYAKMINDVSLKILENVAASTWWVIIEEEFIYQLDNAPKYTSMLDKNYFLMRIYA